MIFQILHNIKHITDIILLTCIISAFCLNLGLLIKCIVNFHALNKEYHICKRTPNLHPIHRDVQYLSQSKETLQSKDTSREIFSHYPVY